MDAILDYIVSRTWIFILTFTLLASIPTLMIWVKPFKNIIITRTIQFGVSILSVALLFYLMMGPHGYAVEYIGGLSNGKELCLIEQHYTGDGDGGTYLNYRLYVFDLKTGQLILREPVDSPELLCVTETSAIFFLLNSAEAYDLKTGKKTAEWSAEKGFEDFPELAVGISDVNRSSGHHQFQNAGWLTLTAKNGHHYTYDLLTQQLVEREYVPSTPQLVYECNEYEVRYNDSTDGKYWYYNFRNKTGELEELVFHDKNYEEIILEGEYLQPKMVSVHPNLNLFVFKHFTTTDYNSSIHTAVGFDHQIKWQLTQQDLQTADNFSNTPLPGITMPLGDLLIATFGGQVICLNAADGTVEWKSVQ